MRYVDEFRDPATCRTLVQRIRATATRRRTIMEVCGGQTHGLLRYGIDGELAGMVELLHGPGCPVCVTSVETLDLAIDVASRRGVTVASFGDMLRVPGTRSSLLAARAQGGDVRVVYSPLDAVQLAHRHRERQVMFLAVGFETTAPATALAVQQATALGLENFSLLVSHVRVQPAMEMLASDPGSNIEGFLAAGHVCTVAGYQGLADFAKRFRLPVVVTGFEPVDLLGGILECVRQLERGEATVWNAYPRSVLAEGNPRAMQLVDATYEVCDRQWRGLGVIPAGGLRLRDAWRRFDAEVRFGHSERAGGIAESPRGDGECAPGTCHTGTCHTGECRSGEVLTGRLRPDQCEHFGGRCTPENPLGAPMVSDEGACAAYYRYSQGRMV